MLTEKHIQTALKAAGAGSGLVMPANDIAAAFNYAILTYGEGQFDTTEKVAALVSECMMESAYFRTTEEYNKTKGDYQPFRGRTFIQITWKANYLSFGKWCNTKGLVSTDDYFVKNPTELSDLKWSAIGGVWYFTQVKFDGKPLTFYANNIDQVGKAVNMGSPFSKSTPVGHAARKAAYIAVKNLGSSIVPPIVLPVPPIIDEKPADSVELPEVVVEPPVIIESSKEKIIYSAKWKTDYVSWRGGNFAPITVTKLIAIPTFVRVTQGGLSFAPKSSMTHAGIGTFDLNTDGMTRDQVWELCRELWEVDIIPAPRGFSADSFQGRTISNTNDGNEHLHCLDRDCYNSMHYEAQAQCREIMAGGDGLIGNRSFVGPSRTFKTAWKDSAYNPVNIKPGGTYKVVSNTLLGLKFDRVPSVNGTKKKDELVVATRLVNRWGRWNAATENDLFYAISDKTQTYLEEIK